MEAASARRVRGHGSGAAPVDSPATDQGDPVQSLVRSDVEQPADVSNADLVAIWQREATAAYAEDRGQGVHGG